MIQAKDEEDSAVAKRKKTPEVARESSGAAGRSSLLLRAAVGAVETDGAEAEEAEKVIIYKIISILFLHASFLFSRFSRAGSSRCAAPWRGARSRGSPRPTLPAAASATTAGRTMA